MSTFILIAMGIPVFILPVLIALYLCAFALCAIINIITLGHVDALGMLRDIIEDIF